MSFAEQSLLQEFLWSNTLISHLIEQWCKCQADSRCQNMVWDPHVLVPLGISLFLNWRYLEAAKQGLGACLQQGRGAQEPATCSIASLGRKKLLEIEWAALKRRKNGGGIPSDMG